MHPEILRELAAQRSREMRDRAQHVLLVRTASKARRAMQRGLSGSGDADEFTVPAIPDYVDGSFLAGPADDRVPSGRRAA
jgi:hypothetical protein